MDLLDPTMNNIKLPADGSWLTTSQLCFVLEDSLLDNPSTCLEAIWARDTLTAAYATSFVEISEWSTPNNTVMANGVFYDDLDASDKSASCFDSICIYDYGDLPDLTIGIGPNDYQTLKANNGPSHLINSGLFLGVGIDNETNGQPTTDATGDGTDEDGLTIFTTSDIALGSRLLVPLNVTNTTGSTAYVEAWIDWNGDGTFAGEMVADLDDTSGLPSYLTIPIPTDANLNTPLGFRIRLSNTDNMTPFGRIGSGEVEDYLININCPNSICTPDIY